MPTDVFISTFGDLATNTAIIDAIVKSYKLNDWRQLQESWSGTVSFSNCVTVIRDTVKICEEIQDAVFQHNTSTADIKRDLYALFNGWVPKEKLQRTLSHLFYAGGIVWLNIRVQERLLVSGLSSERLSATEQICSLVRRLRAIGLGGNEAPHAFAYVVDDLLNDYLRESGNVSLQEGVLEQFTFFAEVVLAAIRGTSEVALQPLNIKDIAPEWEESFEMRRGQLRSRELLDLIIRSGLQEKDPGIIEELAIYLKTQSARRDLITKFNQQLSSHLLRPSVSTVTILDTYMLIIRKLQQIDKSGIILFAASELIRAHLRDREDLVKVILLSLLADNNGDANQPAFSSNTISQSVAKLMENNPQSGYQDYYEGIDLDDLTWEPEPIEAGVGYRGLTHQDALAHILTLESKENFVKELQTILGSRLLDKHEANFEKEIRLLELFKLRFEISNLQASEVMVHDVMESTRTDEAVAVFARYIPSKTIQMNEPDFHARILSRFYWPSLRDETFVLPSEITNATLKYSDHFQLIKPGRKLEWLPALGYVILELQLTGRTIREECTTWQAAVIHQFQHDDDSEQPSLSVAQLMEALEMEKSLLISALTFWVGRTVLEMTAEGHYKLLNHLPNDGEVSAAAAAAQVATSSTALKSSADLLLENAQVYTNFITSMLTNQGGMTAEKILMMLKLLIAGGVSFEVEELKGLLDKLVQNGVLESGGSVYKIAKQ